MRSNFVLPMLLALIVLGGMTAYGQEGPPPGQPPQDSPRGGFGRGRGQGMRPPSFEELDKDKDGKISKSEWAGSAQAFDAIDENHDGFIDRAEWDKWRARMGSGRMGASMLRYLDANNDGKVTREEFAKLAQLFDALDTDHDGSLSPEELGRFNQAMNPDRQNRAGGDSSSPNSERGNRPQMNFDDLDKNKDGKIARSEWQGPAQFFDRIDANHDGFIDKQEWDAWRSRMASGGGPGAGPGRMTDTLLKYLDANHDGKVSREEFGRITQIFDALDKDHDGVLSAEELGGFGAAIAQAQSEATGGVEVDKLFANYDKNKDGRITPDELQNEKLFKALDLNHDGVITREEADQALRDLAARAKQKKDSGK